MLKTCPNPPWSAVFGGWISAEILRSRRFWRYFLKQPGIRSTVVDGIKGVVAWWWLVAGCQWSGWLWQRDRGLARRLSAGRRGSAW